METETHLAFAGTRNEQELAARAFDVMKRKGVLFAAGAPIKMSTDALVKALTKPGAPMAGTDQAKLSASLETALGRNPNIFARDENGDYITTKAGHAPHGGESHNPHTFQQRLNAEAIALDAEAAKEYASSLMTRTAERNAFLSSVVEVPAPLPPVAPMRSYTPVVPTSPETATLIPQHLIPQPPVHEEAERPAVVEPPAQPVSPPAAAAPPAPAAPPAARPFQEPIPPLPRPVQPAQPVTQVPQPQPSPPPVEMPPVEPVPAATAAPTVQPVVEEPVAPPIVAPLPRPVPPPVEAPAAPVVTGPIEVTIPTAEGPVTIDLRAPLDDILSNEAVVAGIETLLQEAVSAEARLIQFGSEIFPEEALERFSKGDFRRIKEYLEEPETGGVASDRDITADVLGRRPDHPDYDRVCFSLDYRLLKEKKDFEFVGIDSDRLWINAAASPVPPPVRKPAEIGQDYRYLEDPAITSVEAEDLGDSAGIAPIEYSLTYYEYENGVLPYDLRFKSISSGPVLEDQRASLLRFEIPQLYVALLAELRYPTGNRGGFIMGLGDLFTEHLVPGARFTISPTDRGQDIFEIHFNRADEREENLLQFDERRGRAVFRPVSFSVEVDPSMLLEQEKFGNLHNQRKLDESERKRPDVIIAAAFEAVGDNVDGKYWAIFDDIFPVVNIERPFSRSWLKTLLSGAYPFFYADETTEGAYFYDPGRRPS